MSKIIEEFIEACIAGDLNLIRKKLAADRGLANSRGKVRQNHREFMSSMNADDGWSALHLASHYGHLNVVMDLVDAGAELNGLSDNGFANTPLMSAVSGGKLDIVRFLLDSGADPKILSKARHSALQLAIAEKKDDIVALLSKEVH